MPDTDPDAYERSDKELVYRRMELHHACIQIIVRQLQSLSEKNIMIPVGGRNIPMRILLAAIIGDFPEQEKKGPRKTLFQSSTALKPFQWLFLLLGLIDSRMVYKSLIL